MLCLECREGFGREARAHERGVDEAGADRVGAHALGGVLKGCDLGESDEGVLARDIGGVLRDTDRIAGLGFAAFSRSRRPVDYRRRLSISSTRETVSVGGISIADGDLVMADDDGAVVIPQDAEQTVLRIARARASGESTVLAELLAGESLRAVWDRHRIL